MRDIVNIETNNTHGLHSKHQSSTPNLHLKNYTNTIPPHEPHNRHESIDRNKHRKASINDPHHAAEHRMEPWDLEPQMEYKSNKTRELVEAQPDDDPWVQHRVLSRRGRRGDHACE